MSMEAVLHSVVPGHPTAVPEAEDSVEAGSRSQRAVGSLRVPCRNAEASVEAVKELLQHGVGLLDGGCTSVSELGHQPDAPIDVKECFGIELSSVGWRRLLERHSV